MIEIFIGTNGDYEWEVYYIGGHDESEQGVKV